MGGTAPTLDAKAAAPRFRGGIAFGAGRFEAERGRRFADPDRAAEELWLRAGCAAARDLVLLVAVWGSLGPS